MDVWRWLGGLSVTDGPVHVALILGALLALAGLLGLRRAAAWWRRSVPLAVALAAVAVGGLWLFLHLAKPWPDGLPTASLGWVGAGFLALVLVPLGWAGQRWRTRGLAVAAALVVVLGAADGIDAVYGAFPTVATALQLTPDDRVDARAVLGAPSAPAANPAADPPAGALWRSWRAPAGLPAHGAVARVDIPAPRSGFHARPAWVYLPPAYLSDRRPLLPLLVMIGGQPGSPRDWLDGGRLAQRMDAFAAAHAGLAPVVLMPDALGGEVANPMCTDSRLGRADTYLAQDVPAWATTHLRIDPDSAHWAVGGFSYGGTCALQLAVAHPDLFPTFFDASGQRGPTLGSRARTLARAFGGNPAALAAVEPLVELTRRSYPSSAGYLVVGAQDRTYRPQQVSVVAAARSAGMTVTATELPGRHSWRVWSRGFTDALPWLAARMGVAP